MRPDRGPFHAKIEKKGLNVEEILMTAATQGWDFLYVAGANPAMKYPSNLWDAVNPKFLVVQDLFFTETAEKADVVLPALCFAEKTGSFLNIAGCAAIKARKRDSGKYV